MAIVTERLLYAGDERGDGDEGGGLVEADASSLTRSDA